MDYFTERNGMRKPIEKTNVIDVSRYGVLLKCCEAFYDNIVWRYHDDCEDGKGPCGIDRWALADEMKYEIPSLYLGEDGLIETPHIRRNIFDSNPHTDAYDQYALLDFIEFMASNVHDVVKGDYHSFFKHYHYRFKETRQVFGEFQKQINSCFEKTGLLYKLNSKGQVERVLENDITSHDAEKILSTINEKGTRELLQEAIELHRSYKPTAARDATEKLWDAFERLKTYYTDLKKTDSADRIVRNISNGNSDYYNLLNAEFKNLTAIGNDYRIRHHETNKIEITDNRYYDYFFNRCLALITLAIQFTM